MAKYSNVLVLCIDRDDDLGRKAGVQGPIVGKQKNLNSAAKLALADPEDSDVNSIFGAVKVFEEVKEQFKNVEVVTLTGHSKEGFKSDKIIMEQLDSVLENFPADAFVLVTDGAEDDQIIPLLQSRAPLISKELIIVKQAKEVEGTYYSIKEALKDPSIARIFFLIPGIVVILWGLLFFLGQERIFFQTMSLVVGAYMILKGTGLEDKIAAAATSVTKAISLQRVSFPLYLMTIMIFLIGIYTSYLAFISPPSPAVFIKAIEAMEQFINFTTIAGVSFVLGQSIDSVQLKKAFLLRRYFLSIVAIALVWFILDTGRRVLIGEPYAGIEFLTVNIVVSLAVALIAYRLSSVLDVRKKITKLMIGLPVYSREGQWIGKVEDIQKNKNLIEYRNIRTKQKITVTQDKFDLRGGRILIRA